MITERQFVAVLALLIACPILVAACTSDPVGNYVANKDTMMRVEPGTVVRYVDKDNTYYGSEFTLRDGTRCFVSGGVTCNWRPLN